jgi:hypothetical protein
MRERNVLKYLTTASCCGPCLSLQVELRIPTVGISALRSFEGKKFNQRQEKKKKKESNQRTMIELERRGARLCACEPFFLAIL